MVLLGRFGFFLIILAQFKSPFGSFWLVSGGSDSFRVVLACFALFQVSLGHLLDRFGLFWFVLARFGSICFSLSLPLVRFVSV